MSQTHDRLRELANCKVGGPSPKWLTTNDWGQEISKLCRDALAEIEQMRATMKRINKICHIPTTAHMKAYTHFQRDFDEIRVLTKEFCDDADSRA
jgi:hypothetical protein